MTAAEPPWEPPLAGTEVEHLLGALDRLRTTFRWKADGLDEPALRTTIAASDLTLGGLLKHLAFVEDYHARTKLAGESPGAPWETVDWDTDPGWDFASAAENSAADLYALYDDAVAQARKAYRAALLDGGLDQAAHAHDSAGRHRLRHLLAAGRLRPASAHQPADVRPR